MNNILINIAGKEVPLSRLQDVVNATLGNNNNEFTRQMVQGLINKINEINSELVFNKKGFKKVDKNHTVCGNMDQILKYPDLCLYSWSRMEDQPEHRVETYFTNVKEAMDIHLLMKHRGMVSYM